MLSQERKSELLKGIKGELAKFNAFQGELDACWKQRSAHIHDLKRSIMCLTHGEDTVKEIEGLVNKRIMVNNDDSVEILMVKDIEFQKWEVRFRGEGFKLYDDGRSCSSIGFDIRYEAFPGENDTQEKPEPFTVVTDADIGKIVKKLESDRDLKITKYRDEVRNKYAKIIETVKNCGIDPKRYRAETRLDRIARLRHDADELYEEAGFRWQDLVQWFGSDEDKAEYLKDLKETIDGPGEWFESVP